MFRLLLRSFALLAITGCFGDLSGDAEVEHFDNAAEVIKIVRVETGEEFEFTSLEATKIVKAGEYKFVIQCKGRDDTRLEVTETIYTNQKARPMASNFNEDFRYEAFGPCTPSLLID